MEAFLAGEIGFDAIPAVIEDCLAAHDGPDRATLENLEAADGFTRREARRRVETRRPRTAAPGRIP